MNILIDNLVVKRGNFKLAVNTQLERGYVYALIGNNGAGKTTLLQSILGGLDVESGNVFYGELGFEHNYEEIKSLYAYMPDECYFMTKIYKIINSISELDKRFSLKRCKELLEKFQINIDKKVKDLSQGSRKKLMFCIALSFDCKVLILDEPTANVDPKSKEMMLTILRDFMDENKTIIFSTHIVSEIDKIADYVLLLKDGKLILKENIVDLQENNRDENSNIQTLEKIILQLLLK